MHMLAYMYTKLGYWSLATTQRMLKNYKIVEKKKKKKKDLSTKRHTIIEKPKSTIIYYRLL